MSTESVTYPETYLHVLECRSGQEWIVPLRGNDSLNLEHQVKKWIRQEFDGAYRLSGDLMPKLDGDYYAQLKTDGEPPSSCRCWDSGGFYLEDVEAVEAEKRIKRELEWTRKHYGR